MNKLKIGFVLDDTLDTPDGVQQYVTTLGEWLSAQGHDVHYLVGETTRSDIKQVHSLSRNFKVRFNGNRLTVPLPANRTKLRDLLKQQEFDVLHVQMPYSPWLAQRVIYAAPARTAVVGTFHIVPYSWSVKIANRALAIRLQRSLKRFDHTFSVSAAAQSFAKHAYKIDSEVLPNVVDEERFRKAKPLAQYSDDVIYIMFLGRLVPRKGCMLLLEAATILNKRKQLPPFQVVIGGKGSLEPQLKKYVTDQSLNNIVSFAGFIPEDHKPSFLASAHIMAFPSSAGESFGIVLIEAMASGRSVVLAGDNQGYRSVLQEKPDLLFSPTNAFELANKLTLYLRDEHARQEAVTWEKKWVKQYDVGVIGKKLLDVYTACCRKHTKQG